MDTNIKNLLIEMMGTSHNDEEFKELREVLENALVITIEQPIKEYIIYLLEQGFINESSEDIFYIMYMGFILDIFKNDEDFLPILIKLIQEPWHNNHEDIASIFQWYIKTPKTIEVLYKTALTKFDYLDFDEAFALAVKCIWALGDINTPESMEKLELLAKSDNEIIKENALNQLERHKDTVEKLHNESIK